jgi:hypothetical protein
MPMVLTLAEGISLFRVGKNEKGLRVHPASLSRMRGECGARSDSHALTSSRRSGCGGCFCARQT